MPILSPKMDFESTPESSQITSPTSTVPLTHPTPPPEPQSVSSPGEVKRQLQVIDEYQAFSPKLTYYMNEVWCLGQAGFNYNLVAVFGSQSTGKSN